MNIEEDILEDIEEEEIPEKPKRSRRKKIVIPDDAHPLLVWRLIKEFSQGELSVLLNMHVKILDAVERGKHELTSEQKKRVRLMTGLKL